MNEQDKLQQATGRLLAAEADDRDLDEVGEAHPADLAQVLRQRSVEDQVRLFRMLDPEAAGAVLSELDDDTLLNLVRALDEEEVSKILDRMPAEEAADVVEELPEEHAEKLLELMEEKKSEDVQELLEYPEHSAGRLMSPDLVSVEETMTVAQAIDHIRKSVLEDRPFELFVTDHHGHLVGAVPLRRLLLAPPETPIVAIRNEDIVSVTPETDQEEVARVVAKYDLAAIPVVDWQHRLLGSISVADVVDIVGEEASEDIFGLAGSDAAELEKRSPRQLAMLRLPWILATLVLELGAGVVIHFYDATLARVILLASFMPVIQAISGNTGLQSVTMIVRGLATGQVTLDRWWEPLRRQMQASAIIGGVCAVVVGLIGSLWHSLAFGLVVAVSMFVSVNLSGLAGTSFPMISKRLGLDPALTAGPFATTFQDVLGVTIFLSLATAMLHWLV
jgi:magnesium transporter